MSWRIQEEIFANLWPYILIFLQEIRLFCHINWVLKFKFNTFELNLMVHLNNRKGIIKKNKTVIGKTDRQHVL